MNMTKSVSGDNRRRIGGRSAALLAACRTGSTAFTSTEIALLADPLNGWASSQVSAHFSSRAPDTAKIKPKMLYAGTKDTVKKSLQGLQVEVQGTDKSEVSKEAVIDKCKSLSK
jgi:cystathionine beta-lyase/cystathionine gamma-synthase